jgi:hypothetical protein
MSLARTRTFIASHGVIPTTFGTVTRSVSPLTTYEPRSVAAHSHAGPAEPSSTPFIQQGLVDADVVDTLLPEHLEDVRVAL